MGRLRRITFTGIDEHTDLNQLLAIQYEYPKQIEFGVLLSENWKNHGNRYASSIFLEHLKNYPLNYAAHLCGRLAREAVLNNWEPVLNFCNGYFSIFKRCQLNVANNPKNPSRLELSVPKTLDEIIIQQTSADDCDLFLNSLPNDQLSVLIDGSGGRGIDTEFKPISGDFKVSYAGGINPDNVTDKVNQLVNSSIVSDFCIDMESGVRINDFFDIQKVMNIIDKMRPYL